MTMSNFNANEIELYGLTHPLHPSAQDTVFDKIQPMHVSQIGWPPCQFDTFHLILAPAMEGKILCVQQLVLQFLNEETLSTTPNTAKLS